MSLVLNVEILGEYKNLTKATQGAEKSFTNFRDKVVDVGKKIGAVVAGIGVGLGAAVASQVKPAIDAASNLQESINAVNVAFGDAAKGVFELGEDSAKSLGLAKSELYGIATQFSSFAKTVAGEGGDASVIIGEIAKRGADFASVFNLEVDEALTKFQSGLAGSSEPLRAYGIDVSAATVTAYALANGIGDGSGKLTEQEKILARYGTIMEQTSMVQGDFQNTSDGVANQQRILAATLEDTRAKIGEKLLPILGQLQTFILDTVIPAFEDFWYWLTDPASDAQLQIQAVQDGWEKFGISFGTTSSDIKSQDVFGWLSDSIVSVEKMIVHFGTTMSEIWGGIQLLMMGPLHFSAGFRKIAGAIGEADKAAEQIKFWDQLANVSERERQQAPPAARMTPSRILGTSVGADTAARQGDITAGGTVIYNNNVYVKKSTATGQDIATALNRTIKAAGVQVIRAQ